MRVENTYDEVMFAAAEAGLTPDGEDVASVRVPAGEDESSFTSSLRARAQRIAALSKQGNRGEARRLAEEGSAQYRQKFDELMPVARRAHPDDDLSLSELGQRMFRR